jgi:hypothetical protein
VIFFWPCLSLLFPVAEVEQQEEMAEGVQAVSEEPVVIHTVSNPLLYPTNFAGCFLWNLITIQRF